MEFVTIRCEPRFYISTSLAEIHILQEIGKSCGDLSVRQLVINGGFIHKWCLQLTPVENIVKDPIVSATFNELTSVLNILDLKCPLTVTKREIANRMRAYLTACVRIANEQLRKIEFEVVEYSKEERIAILKSRPLINDGSHYESLDDMLDDYHIPQFGLKNE